MELTPAVIAKCKLENAITKAIREFEVETEYVVSGISINHKYLENDYGVPVVYIYEVIAEIND